MSHKVFIFLKITHIWKKANKDKLEDQASEMVKQFKEKFSLDRAINEMWDLFKSNILKILQESVPSKMSSSRFNQPWINHTVKQMTRWKKRSFDKARRTKKKSNIARYRKLKSATQKECRKAYKDYVENIIDPDLSSNPKRFWSFIKSKSTGVSPMKDSDGKTYSTLNTNEDKSTIPDKRPSPHPTMGPIEITENGVFKLLSNLKVHKAAGQHIPTQLLRKLAPISTPMQTTLFQASINQGTIPPEWKEANVVPIFKKGDKSRASNYRPVSLTVVTCKMLEHIICSSIHKHLEKHRILTDTQHGFRKKRSCESQLDLAKSMDLSEQIDLILLDFSKAFDKVPHERLLY